MGYASRVIICCLVFLLGSIWGIGCNRTPTGGGPGGTPPPEVWNIDLTIDPDTVLSVTGLANVHCFLTRDGEATDGEQIYFRSYSADFSTSALTTSSWTDSTSSTGTDPVVIYRPNNFEGAIDTIYAVFYETYQGDTLAWNWATVNILHP